MSSTGPCAICASIPFRFNPRYLGSRNLPRKLSKSEERLLSQPLATKLFHEECVRCSSNDPSLDPGLDPKLCPFCRHLRLPHLIYCIPERGEVLDFFITVCRFEELPERAGACSFCRLLARAALRYGCFSGMEPMSAYQGDLLAISFKRGTVQTHMYVGGKNRGWRYSIWCSGGLPLSRGVGWPTEVVDSEDGVDVPATDFSTRATPGIKRAVGGFVSWSFVKQSLDTCLQEHDECVRPGAGASIAIPADFRVIDVKKRCLVQMPPSCQFVALSYVWGREPDPTKLFTTTFNLKAFQENGSLAAQDMPATVEDAMEVCRQLEEPYLWIDRFCIVQDNYSDKAQQVAAMAAIYSLARLVIIITDGNSDSGIAGVSRERPQGQAHDRIAGLDFISELPCLKEVEDGCIWSTRGWTYQEIVLAGRKLILTESQAFLECRREGLSEDGVVATATRRPPVLESSILPESGALVEAFYSHLTRYRTRLLTNTSDIHNAIDGVANALYGGSGSLWQGLPRRDIDRALLWCIERTRDLKSWIIVPNPSSNGTRPSWSWSATDKQIRQLNAPTVLDKFNYCETLVAWAGIREGVDGPGRSAVESIETVSGRKPLSHFHKRQDKCGCPGEMSQSQVEQLLYPVVAWSYGCIKAPYPFAKPENTTFPALMSQVKSRWACRHDYWVEAFEAIVAPLDDTGTPVPCSPDTIFTWAQSALFLLQDPPTSRMRNSYLCIVDEAGQPAGLLISHDDELDLKPDIGDSPKLEFIALSMGNVDGIVEYENGHCWMVGLFESGGHRSRDYRWCQTRPVPPHLTVCDREGECMFPIPIVNVMMIERTGENHARRAGVGWIYLTSWVSARPEFKMIYLE